MTRHLVGGMYGDLGRRQRQDQPAAAGVDRASAEHIEKEVPIGLRIGAVEDDMCSGDHALSPRSTSETATMPAISQKCPGQLPTSASVGGPAYRGEDGRRTRDADLHRGAELPLVARVPDAARSA